jgi:DUF4097 and DUF4098 domain-containing protein YvlB
MRSIGLAVLAALVVGTAPAAVEAQQVAGTHRLPGGRTAVYNLAGRVTIERSAGGDVTVDVAPGGADAGRLRVASGPVRGREAFRVIYPGDRILYPAGATQRTELRVRDDGTFGGGDDDDRARARRVVVTDEGTGAEVWADLTIRVPDGRDVAVHHAVGLVTVRNVNGTLLVDTHSAEVEASGTRGALTIDVGSGGVRARDVQGRLLIDTGSGDVRLEGSSGDEVRIDTGSGNVTLARVTADRLNLDTGSGSVLVGLAGDVTELLIDTGSGDVTLRVPDALGASLEIETGSGGIEVDVPVAVTRRGRNELSGSLGDGRGRIVIDTGSGDVTVARSE